MARPESEPRTTFAAQGDGSLRREPPVRRSAARGVALGMRLIAAPFAAIAAAVAGLVFALLLPICGIATICEGIATSAWRFVRESFARAPHAPARRG